MTDSPVDNFFNDVKKIENAHWHLSIGIEFENAFWKLIGAFSAAQHRWTENVERPAYYCGSHSLEHYLKGYLDLKNIRYPKDHDLIKLLNLGGDEITSFFDLNTDDINVIKLMNERYSNSLVYGKDDLRYTSNSGLRVSPHPDVIQNLLKKLKEKLTGLFSFKTEN